MSEKSVRPSTIDGIKSLAAVLKRERGIKYTEALELAAKVAGYNNFKHAQRKLLEQPYHPLWITARWFDRKSQTRGQETLKIGLTKPYEELVSPGQARADRYLCNVRAEAPDHILVLSKLEGEELARRRVCEVARTLQFMELTGLKPSEARRAGPGDRRYQRTYRDTRVPNQDHPTVWWDPVHKRHVLADEPYVRRKDPISEERLAWAQEHGWEIVKPDWGSIYWTDGGCWLFLMADRKNGPSLVPIAAALSDAPSPAAAKTWSGFSSEYSEVVETPGTKTQMMAKAAEEKKPRKAARKRASVAYTEGFFGRRLRPDGKMPIEAHREVGRLLKSVLAAAEKRAGASSRIKRMRHELDEWMMREYNSRVLDQETFSNLYYHEGNGDPQSPIDRGEMIRRLETAKAILSRQYPDCPPLDALTDQADKAIASLRSWRI